MIKQETWEEYADELKAELNKVKQQLAIAVEALEKYADRSKWFDYCVLDDGYIDGESSVFIEDGYDYAEQALKQIKDLEK